MMTRWTEIIFAELDDVAIEQCTCGNPNDPNVVHRYDGPCYSRLCLFDSWGVRDE